MIKLLDWDSGFFGFPVGQIKLTSDNDWDEYVSGLSNFKLVYLITPEDIKVPQEILQKRGGSLINQRILYQKALGKADESIPDHIQEHKGIVMTQDFINLAYLSGSYSRFRIDPNIPDGKFEELYRIWIKKSLERHIADKIYVSTRNDKISAMLTCKLNQHTCNIGLVAVHESERGKGTGRYLMKILEQQAYDQGISQVLVPTQSNNSIACRFYEKSGYTPQEINNYYHFWIK